MIRVLVSKFNSKADEEVLFKISIYDNGSLSFPFNNIISSLKVLYPKADVITFKIF